MPSTSGPQHRLMEGIAHGSIPPGKGKPSKAIATEFARADGDKTAGSPKSRSDHMARVAKHSTQAETGKQFGKSQATVSRTLRRGFTQEGSAG